MIEKLYDDNGLYATVAEDGTLILGHREAPGGHISYCWRPGPETDDLIQVFRQGTPAQKEAGIAYMVLITAYERAKQCVAVDAD